MNSITILLLGFAAILAGYFFWKRIQLSRQNDADFERRDDVMDKNN